MREAITRIDVNSHVESIAAGCYSTKASFSQYMVTQHSLHPPIFFTFLLLYFAAFIVVKQRKHRLQRNERRRAREKEWWITTSFSSLLNKYISNKRQNLVWFHTFLSLSVSLRSFFFYIHRYEEKSSSVLSSSSPISRHVYFPLGSVVYLTGRKKKSSTLFPSSSFSSCFKRRRQHAHLTTPRHKINLL